MAITKTPTTLVSNQTVSAGGTYTSGTIDLTSCIDFAIGYTMAFAGSAALGARVEIFADPTGANSGFSVGTYDDHVDSYDIAVDAGHTVNGLAQFNRSAKYIKIRLTNLSGSVSITGVYLYAIVQAQA
jgi:hypothetical protein